MARTRTPAPLAHTAVAYLRVSTSAQELGPEAQRATITAWAAREGVTIVAWHCDHGVSGGAPMAQRPALLAAIADVGELRAEALVVARRDRLARDVMTAAIATRLVAAHGARITSTAGEGEGNDPASALMRTLVDAFAEYERALIASRTRAALAVKKARGERTGECPRGTRATASGALEPCTLERARDARVRELRDAGHNYSTITAMLASEGYLSRRGTPLSRASVHAIATAVAA